MFQVLNQVTGSLDGLMKVILGLRVRELDEVMRGARIFEPRKFGFMPKGGRVVATGPGPALGLESVPHVKKRHGRAIQPSRPFGCKSVQVNEWDLVSLPEPDGATLHEAIEGSLQFPLGILRGWGEAQVRHDGRFEWGFSGASAGGLLAHVP